ncbi:YkgJ family cysteine cluster protein [Sediminicola sp. 1XM1-17]|uniref:YkgJ family cysteine cluster protein n=1 Tax=Sediminicola sp. 1XM1-17 TaxID=3127702 RepID=UPI00307773F3
MTIESRVAAVEALYSKLEIEISKFQSHTKLQCASGCGKCCTKPDIDASPLEFLPWAFHLFLTGKAETTLETLKERTATHCFLYNPVSLLGGDNGSCGHYKYRGLICRLFGYGASRDKMGQLRLATCKIIKESQQENYLKANEDIGKGLYVPIFTDYYMNLSQIDYKLGNMILPINQAFKLAIEEVLQYYAYRPFPGGLKITA